MDRSITIPLLVGLIAILDPFAVIPYYLTTNPTASPKVAKKDARIMAVSAFLILTIGTFLGTEILQWFGLEMRYFRIAGGVIIAYNAFRMVSGLLPAGSKELGTKANDINARGLIIPLTMPLVAGPGSLAYLIGRYGYGNYAQPILFSIAIGCILYYFVILYSSYVQKKLGDIGLALLTRFLGLLLLGIGVQAILTNL